MTAAEFLQIIAITVLCSMWAGIGIYVFAFIDNKTRIAKGRAAYVELLANHYKRINSEHKEIVAQFNRNPYTCMGAGKKLIDELDKRRAKLPNDLYSTITDMVREAFDCQCWPNTVDMNTAEFRSMIHGIIYVYMTNRNADVVKQMVEISEQLSNLSLKSELELQKLISEQSA